MKFTFKKTVVNILRFIIPLGLGVLLIWKLNNQLTDKEYEEMIEAVKKADYSWILLSMFFGVLSHASRGYRWKFLLEPIGLRPKFINSFSSVLIGYFANLFFSQDWRGSPLCRPDTI